MLVIRNEQLTELGNSTLDRDLVRHLRGRFPRHLANRSDDDLLQVARISRKLGARYGIERDDNIGTLADLVVMYGPSFDEQEWANAVLRDTRIDGRTKVGSLLKKVNASGTPM